MDTREPFYWEGFQPMNWTLGSLFGKDFNMFMGHQFVSTPRFRVWRPRSPLPLRQARRYVRMALV